MPNLEPTNYVKLSVRHATPLDDAESVPRPLLDLGGDVRSKRIDPEKKYVTTWIWPFSDKSKLEAGEALGLAQSKRSKLREANPKISPAAFQLCTFGPSTLRGVREIGESVREPLDVVEGADEVDVIELGGVRSPGLAKVSS